MENSRSERLKELIKFWGYNETQIQGETFKVIVKYHKNPKPDKNGREYGFFYDVRDLNGKELYYPNNLGKPRIFAIHKDIYKDSEFWLISVSTTKNNKRSQSNPYELEISNYILGKPKQTTIDIITQNEVDTKDKSTELTPKEHIEKCYRRLDNPKSNKTIANLMREIGKGMYSSKQRMIFELLQNADDAPETDKIEFHIDTKDDYLFIMHDGSKFSKEDVDAVTSAAESTKRADKQKTGYKGIGFKSVFTDSREVWIKSGKYQFAFLRNSPKFKDYYSLYLERLEKYPEYLKERRQDFADVEKTFNPTTDVPWQIMPIWQETLPQVFEETNFTRHQNNVQIALNIGRKEIREQGGYISAIGDIIKKPQFILFLRNTSKFRSPKNGVTISRIDNENITTINKRTSDDENMQYNYYKSYCNIEISDSILKEVGILRTKESNEIGETTYFTTLTGDKIETIPSKLAEATETQISFAFIINEGEISVEKAYVEDIYKYSSFFAFLPMEDTRFKLPFLVNADFIPSSDRETLQGDNLWNKYIITKIAEKHIESINNFAKEAAQEKSLFFNYLSLLLRELIPEDETANSLINIYNDTYCNLLENTPLVVNDNNEIQLLNETILDMSDISNIFDNELFYLITGTDKRLPHNNLNISYLENYSYLEVEKVSLEDISKKITPEIYQRIGDYIKDFDNNKRNELIKWLDKLAKHTPELVLNIPLFPYNDELKSINELSDEEDVFLFDIKTKDYSEILSKLDYEVIDVSFENEYYINVSISKLTNYINNNQLMYNRIASRCKLANLTPIEKLKLLDFFQENEFMKGIGETKYFGELKLFNDENGIARPLWDLINYDSYLEIESLESFRMNRDEYGLVYTRWGKELISSENIFEKFILKEELFKEWTEQFNERNIDNYIDNIIKIFNAKDENSEINPKKWNSIPWIFINNEKRFKYCSEIFWSKSFDKVNNDDFNVLVNLIQKCDMRLIPHQNCGKLLDKFSLSYDSNNIDDWNNIKDINTKDANLLLDWMENDGNYSSFFDDFYFEKESDDKWNIVSNENEIRFYTSIGHQLTEYIRENCDEKFINLQNELYGKNRDSLGVLQGDKLIREIIDSCIYNQEFANHLPKKIELDLIDKFISNLDKFELFSDNQYDQTSPEYKILVSLMGSVEDEFNVTDNVEDIIDKLKSKTTVDGTPLSEFNYSDKVFIKINDRTIELSLSLILEEYKGETDILSVLIDNFNISNKSKLRKLFFNTRIMKPEEITEKINKNQSSEYLSVYQTLFRSLISDAGYYKCKLSKKDFDEKTNSSETFQKEYLEFFDLLLKSDYYPENFHVIGDLDLLVDSSVACNSEKLPEWLFEWKSSDNSKEKLLSHFGYNSKDSSIVKMRQSMITDNYSEDTVIGFFNESKEQAELLYNTLEWLSTYSTEIITKNIEIIKRICTSIELNSDTNSVTIPIIKNITNTNQISYSLETVETDKQLYLLQEKNKDIFYNIFDAMHQTCMIIDDKCGTLKKYFSNSCEIEIEDNYNEDLITKNSKLWDEEYYKKWEHYSNCPIYIYNGDKLPKTLSFEDYTIIEYTDEVACQIDNCFYISQKASRNIFCYNLEDIIGKDLLDDLRDWHNKTIEDETLLYENHIEYNETIDRILQDRFGISKEDQKEEHNQSKVEAIYFLAEQGYDITNANDNSYSIDNILTPDGDTVKFIIRGAKGGLLYLDKDHWKMLDDEDTHLIAFYPGNEPRIFYNKMDLLNEELAKNVLFRVENTKKHSDIDDAFESLGDNAHLIFVTSEKMEKDIFARLQKKIKPESDHAVANDNFEL